ncbi:MAG: UPF0149 family protein [Gammaproteobacteria bacterium]
MSFNDLDQISLSNALSNAGVLANIYESHGTLCGLVCTRGKVDYQSWMVQLFEPMDGGEQALTGHDGDVSSSTVSDNPLLKKLHNDTVLQFNDESFSFYLLLPEDEDGLDERVNALADWCKGFLFGLAAGEVNDFSSLPADVQEISRDIIEISQATLEDGVEAESDEAAYTELVEYVKVGVLLINEELRPYRNHEQEKNTLH